MQIIYVIVSYLMVDGTPLEGDRFEGPHDGPARAHGAWEGHGCLDRMWRVSRGDAGAAA